MTRRFTLAFTITLGASFFLALDTHAAGASSASSSGPETDSFCAQLSTDATEQCVPVDHGPAEAWDLEASKWRQPPGPPSAPLVALWAAASAPLDDLALNRDGAFSAYGKHIDEAMAFAKTKNAESLLASLRRQKEVLDRITARKAELTPGN